MCSSRSSTSLRSSQESADSVNSSKQLLDKTDQLDPLHTGTASSGGGEASSKREKKVRRGKSAIAPQPEEDC